MTKRHEDGNSGSGCFDILTDPLGTLAFFIIFIASYLILSFCKGVDIFIRRIRGYAHIDESGIVSNASSIALIVAIIGCVVLIVLGLIKDPIAGLICLFVGAVTSRKEKL